MKHIHNVSRAEDVVVRTVPFKVRDALELGVQVLTFVSDSMDIHKCQTSS